MKHKTLHEASLPTPLPTAYPLATTRGPAAALIVTVALATLLVVALGWPLLASGASTFQGGSSLGWDRLTTEFVRIHP